MSVNAKWLLKTKDKKTARVKRYLYRVRLLSEVRKLARDLEYAIEDCEGYGLQAPYYPAEVKAGIRVPKPRQSRENK